MPFRVHGGLELLGGLFLLAAPWLFRFDTASTSQNLFVGPGAATLQIFLFTQWREEPQRRRPAAA